LRKRTTNRGNKKKRSEIETDRTTDIDGDGQSDREI